MLRIATLVLATALFTLPAAAQTKGKSETAPGQIGVTPGQTQDNAAVAQRHLAPGRVQDDPGGAKSSQSGYSATKHQSRFNEEEIECSGRAAATGTAALSFAAFIRPPTNAHWLQE